MKNDTEWYMYHLRKLIYHSLFLEKQISQVVSIFQHLQHSHLSRGYYLYIAAVYCFPEYLCHPHKALLKYSIWNTTNENFPEGNYFKLQGRSSKGQISTGAEVLLSLGWFSSHPYHVAALLRPPQPNCPLMAEFTSTCEPASWSLHWTMDTRCSV